MRIRTKIILLVLPVLVATVVLVGVSSYLSASAGINRITRDFLGFKVYELKNYAQSQYQLLVDNGLTDKPEMVQATKGSIDVFAKGLIQSKTELIFTLTKDGTIVSSSSPVSAKPGEGSALAAALQSQPDGLLTPLVEGVPRIAKGFWFEPYGWYYVVSETSASFYSDVGAIGIQTGAILVASILVAGLMLFLFARSLTRPLGTMVTSMKEIITSGELSKEVVVEFDDETGTLAHTFNIMTGELDKAWTEIKNYALQAALAQKKEQRIRTIFQKFVPQEVIDQFEASPETMLVGEDRVLSILFSDIRSFTSISEKMQPYDLVQNLNRYFTQMVDIIIDRKGTVDKYIGDAIMAFWGAPVKHENDPMDSVMAGIEMSEAVRRFNEEQIAAGRPEFKIGIGLNYGVVTVGNMGSEKKLNYTVIGDMVNLASRMEGLTKEYHQVLLISESLHLKVKDHLPTRLLDTVAVKGKERGVRIYTTERSLDANQTQGWKLHNEAMNLYYARKFQDAIEHFDRALKYLPDDFNIDMIRSQCVEYLATPPPANWNGVRKMDHK